MPCFSREGGLIVRKRNQTGQGILHVLFFFIVCFCIVPFILLIVSSISDQSSILTQGYSFFPSKLSFSAYELLFVDAEQIVRSYGISLTVTIIGTVVSLALISLLAYPISRKDMPLRNFLAFFICFTMLFNGGLVSTYIVYTQIIDIKNTVLALIIPGLLMNGFYVFLARTFFMTSIPVALLEAATIDGAGEFKVFFKIVLPLSLPVQATLGLFQSINYWNDWYNGLIYITDRKLFSLQFLLNKILLEIQFLTNNAMVAQYAETASIPTETVRMAMAFIGILPILIAYPFFQKYFVKGLTIGAIKG
jgi:putative aldouronate transport system permease protein